MRWWPQRDSPSPTCPSTWLVCVNVGWWHLSALGATVPDHVAHPGVECLLQAAETLLTDIGETVVACPTYGQRNKQ